MNPERLKDALLVAKTGELSATAQIKLVKMVTSLQQTNRKLNRRAQDADVAFKEAMIALQAKGWTWRGGNFGRAMLAYYSTQLEQEIKRLRAALKVCAGSSQLAEVALTEPTASVADEDDE